MKLNISKNEAKMLCNEWSFIWLMQFSCKFSILLQKPRTNQLLLFHIKVFSRYIRPCKQSFSVQKKSFAGEHEDLFHIDTKLSATVYLIFKSYFHSRVFIASIVDY